MSVGGRFAPRRLLRGSLVRVAQSNGEWPGPRITLRDGRCEGASVLVVRLLAAAAADGLRRVAAAEGGGRRADAFTFGGTRRPWPVGLRVGGRFCCVFVDGVGRGTEGGGMREGLFVVGEVIVGAFWLGWSEDLSGSCRLSSGTCTIDMVAEAFGVDCAESVS